MGYIDSQVHAYHYHHDHEMALRWLKETFPLPDEIEMKGKSNAASSGTGANLTAPAPASTPVGPAPSSHIIGAAPAAHGLVNQYWDCFDDEEQWTMFHGLKMACNGDLFKDGVLLGNNFHRADRLAALAAATKPPPPNRAPTS
ncbi:AEL221Cp [Eremothecium gossypii ATCC 10895]|uniref:AEL221Cp n=1 Tax=Eremothecium gossypii (strain ATCC 10895 / CBS 109.51 / FGSC 9923 / NRRL Y-1056) TaxID=284811 RepID=Q758I3_EREGS|nr:AEL221Cp [Eremothecium gossypii ATCC 10895]AAS52464.1 AEL221Cp [Eremothecium gossypii ATCC 10895]AEY96763.1 FAEL221Cp [Eremothecium gossypii FDAG1]AGO12140.1 AaceriAEL221Cp [[Ashbya] aceris (nom. inval.)]